MRSHVLSITVMLAIAFSALLGPLGVWDNPLTQKEVLALLAGQDPVSVSTAIENKDSLDIFASTHFRHRTPGYLQTAQPEVSAIYRTDRIRILTGDARTGLHLTMNGVTIQENELMPDAAQEGGVPAAGHPFEHQAYNRGSKGNDDNLELVYDALAKNPPPAALEVGAVYVGDTHGPRRPLRL